MLTSSYSRLKNGFPISISVKAVLFVIVTALKRIKVFFDSCHDIRKVGFGFSGLAINICNKYYPVKAIKQLNSS